MKARIGMVNFINTAPLYVTWQQRVARPDWLVTEGAPTTLNRMLCNNELDLGFVSSHAVLCALPGLPRKSLRARRCGSAPSRRPRWPW